LVIPRSEADKLVALDAAGVDFPLVYVAHELPAGRVDKVLPGLPPTPADRKLASGPAALVHTATFHRVTMAQAAALVPAPPPPAATMRSGQRLGTAARRTLASAARTVPALFAGTAAIAAAPAAGALALGAIGAVIGLDPVIFGAIGPYGRVVIGAPAVFFALCQWSW
jgi:hypothetical protein